MHPRTSRLRGLHAYAILRLVCRGGLEFAARTPRSDEQQKTFNT